MSTNTASGNWNPADFWHSRLLLAPTNLAQPILSGWSLNINNFTAPQTEVNVLAKHSYGRQIGRISDALCMH